MADTLSTPIVDRLRQNGDWSPSLDDFYEWDPDWTERCARMATNPWSTGILPIKWIELTCIALNAACTHRNTPGVRRHIRAALSAGATREEILATLKGVSVLGVHSLALAVPILLEEAKEAGVQPVTHPPGTVSTPVVDHLKAAGQFNEAWDAIYALDPRWLDEFLATCDGQGVNDVRLLLDDGSTILIDAKLDTAPDGLAMAEMLGRPPWPRLRVNIGGLELWPFDAGLKGPTTAVSLLVAC